MGPVDPRVSLAPNPVASADVGREARTADPGPSSGRASASGACSGGDDASGNYICSLYAVVNVLDSHIKTTTSRSASVGPFGLRQHHAPLE